MEPTALVRETKVHRKLVMDTIVQQALTLADWRECSADLMAANGISESDVLLRLKHRAIKLVAVPFVLNLLAWVAILSFIMIREHYLWSLRVLMNDLPGLMVLITLPNFLYYLLLCCVRGIRLKISDNWLISIGALTVVPFGWGCLTGERVLPDPVNNWIGSAITNPILLTTYCAILLPTVLLTVRCLYQPLAPPGSARIGKHRERDSL